MVNITVIMPLFNAEKYLPEALQSVLNQTYRDFEFICINDCSSDDTAIILKHFQEKDKRIKILTNRERLGAGPSRNRGLKAANGKYVIFLDGDDIFEETLLEAAFIAMEEVQADIVMFEYSPHTPVELMYTKKEVQRSKQFVEKYCKRTFSIKNLEPLDFPDWSDSPCNKMFNRRFIEEKEIQFQNLQSANDVYFVRMALFCADKIIWMNDRRVMVYAREHSEPFRISNDRDPMCAYYAMEKLAKELCRKNVFDFVANFYFFSLAMSLQHLLSQERNEERKKKFFLFLKQEGIEKCIAYGRESYRKVDSYYRYILEKILYGTYESVKSDVWDTYFQYYLMKNGKMVLEFLKDELSKGKRIVLWGIGTNGRILLDYLDKHSIKISALTDTDCSKHGSMVNGYIVLDPDAIWEAADLIIVTSKQILWAIKDRNNHLGIELMDILPLLQNR